MQQHLVNYKWVWLQCCSMSQRIADMGGSEMRFNHGLAVSEDRPDVTVSIRALRRAAKFTQDADDEERFMSILGHLTTRQGYTEGHHAVRASLSEADVRHLHLAHMVALENTPEWCEEIRRSFRQNKEVLPNSA